MKIYQIPLLSHCPYYGHCPAGSRCADNLLTPPATLLTTPLVSGVEPGSQCALSGDPSISKLSYE